MIWLFQFDFAFFPTLYSQLLRLFRSSSLTLSATPILWILCSISFTISPVFFIFVDVTLYHNANATQSTQDVNWTSYVHSIYVLCLLGTDLWDYLSPWLTLYSFPAYYSAIFYSLAANALKLKESVDMTDSAQKMMFFIKDFFSKCNQIRRKLRIWSHLLKKSFMENFIFSAEWRIELELNIEHIASHLF